MTRSDMFYNIILMNEVSGNIAQTVKFTWAGGTSGYSFGVTQLDVSHSSNAVACLRECGFSEDEMRQLQLRQVDSYKWSPRLAAHAGIIKKWDEIQLQHCLDSTQIFLDRYHVTPADDAAFMMVADTINQFGSLGQESGNHLSKLGRAFTAEDLRDWKLTWAYGEKHSQDVKRRYQTVVNIAKGAK